jgi:hypothetical protein
LHGHALCVACRCHVCAWYGCWQAHPSPAIVSVVQCALILLAPIEPLFTHAGHVFVDPALAARAKAKAALLAQHIDSDSDSSQGDTVGLLQRACRTKRVCGCARGSVSALHLSSILWIVQSCIAVACVQSCAVFSRV